MLAYNLISKAILIITFISLVSCSPILYSTLQPNTPLPKEKGELQVGYGNPVNLALKNGRLGLGFTGSYAFSNQFFVSGNYLLWWGDVDQDSLGLGSRNGFLDITYWDSDGHVFDLGIGKYWVHEPDDQYRGEITAGVGMGFIQNRSEDLSFVNTRYVNYFVQPAFGFKSDNFWFTASTKINLTNFSSLEWGKFRSSFAWALNQFYEEKKSKINIEPAVGFGFFSGVGVMSATYSLSTLRGEALRLEEGQPVIINQNFTISVKILLNLKKKRTSNNQPSSSHPH